LAKQKDYSAHL